jgi:hypothetical protein
VYAPDRYVSSPQQASNPTLADVSIPASIADQEQLIHSYAQTTTTDPEFEQPSPEPAPEIDISTAALPSDNVENVIGEMTDEHTSDGDLSDRSEFDTMEYTLYLEGACLLEPASTACASESESDLSINDDNDLIDFHDEPLPEPPSSVDSTSDSEYQPVETEDDPLKLWATASEITANELSPAWNSLETFQSECCPHLHSRISSFLLLCQLERINCRQPSSVVHDVLMLLTSNLLDLDHHEHLTSYIGVFQKLLHIDFRLRHHCGAWVTEDVQYYSPVKCIADADIPSVPVPLQHSLAETSEVTASKLLMDYRVSSENSSNVERYGQLLDRIVAMFYRSPEREQKRMCCTLYNCYRRWRIYYAKAAGGQFKLLSNASSD